uniref:Mucin-5AC n=1 Tax=Leptobrachium leishanense TaxID=445787 RepID=A0A8C5ML18_9ANUR
MEVTTMIAAKPLVKIWGFLLWTQIGMSASTTDFPPLRVVTSDAPFSFANHSGQVCSAWGNFYHKTFDGVIYHFPGTCNYAFASHCKNNYEDFNIQIRRTVNEGRPLISHILISIEGVLVEMQNNSVTVDGVLMKESTIDTSRVHGERIGEYIQIKAEIGLKLSWNEKDSLMLELSSKYMNQTCGLCGDFNQVRGDTEFMSNGVMLSPVNFGNLQKVNGPNEDCTNPPPTEEITCSDKEEICKNTLKSPAFSKCNDLVEVQDFIKACEQDLCRCANESIDDCMCNTFSEYSRQCAHSGAGPGNWRTSNFCDRSCPDNMVYQECGSPCADTCSNSERSMLCEEPCLGSCVCPSGTVLDDINNTGCVPHEECFCVYNNENYAPGSSYYIPCHACTCLNGKWSCEKEPCTGSCSVEGGSHITTFDKTEYTFHGDCNYVLVKPTNSSDFAVLVELRQCGLSNSDSCLKSVLLTLKGGETNVLIKPSGNVFLNQMITQLPVSAANLTMFRPSSACIVIDTAFGVQLQLQTIPTMQLHAVLHPSHQGQTSGLCGNFNNILTDDFKANNDIIEGTAAAFANTWKVQSSCPNVKNMYEDPCSLNAEKGKYAEHWCALLTDSNGPFSQCHGLENPLKYYSICLYDTCSCKDSEDCMCAALSSYAYACAKKGLTLNGWRDTVCTKYTKICEKSQEYSYSVSQCQPSCRSQSSVDVTCGIRFYSVEGCVCKKGTLMDERGICVTAEKCPCYYNGVAMESGEVVYNHGIMCMCTKGQLNCDGSTLNRQSRTHDSTPLHIAACFPPLIYHNCSSAPKSTKGLECQKSCQTLDMDCYSSECISGCVCPNGLVLDGKGDCMAEQQCPCVHNEATFRQGEVIMAGCNTCTCRARKWNCTQKQCLGTCSVYGNGHYTTFDGKRYSFNGNCEYTLVQDHCGRDRGNTFRVITENIPCGTTGTTCSKSIKLFTESSELILNDEKLAVVNKNNTNIEYEVEKRGLFMVIKLLNGIIMMWDRHTTIFIKLNSDYKGHVCGLCGNYDGNADNEFTTRSQSVVENILEFGNSWKMDPQCPDVLESKDPCIFNPYRKPWAQRKCSIITSKVFRPCHPQVNPIAFYEACLTDACACDSGGDCECVCTAVASYAQACSEAGVCIRWRTPTMCPLFCDYYNAVGDCEWHYKPCGPRCMKTCKNPKGECKYDLLGCEGCYPSCPASSPFFNEDTSNCVAQCGCYDIDKHFYKYGEKVPSQENCQFCQCFTGGISCKYDVTECQCEYEGKVIQYLETIKVMKTETKECKDVTCHENGTVIIMSSDCAIIAPFTESQQFNGRTPYEVASTQPSSSPQVITEHTVQTFSTQKRYSTTNSFETPTYDVQTSIDKVPTGPLFSSTFGYGYSTDTYSHTIKNFDNQALSTPKVSATTPPVQSSTFTPPAETLVVTTGTSPKPSSSSHTTTIFNRQTSSPKVFTESVVTTASTTLLSVCIPKCHWTPWYDENRPSLTNEGDRESYEICKAKRGGICKSKSHIQDIQCRAKNFPNALIAKLGQKFQCDVSTGLTCHNEDNKRLFKMCLNFEISFFCCDDESHCTTMPPVQSSTFIPPTETLVETTGTSPKPSPFFHTTTIFNRQTSSPKDFTESIVTTDSTTLLSVCIPKCHWTPWYDENRPSLTNEGDRESYEICQAKRGGICKSKSHIQDIQCRAKNFPNALIAKLGQKFQCDVSTGLTCHNKDNKRLFKMCLNFEISFFCCDDESHCTITPPVQSSTFSPPTETLLVTSGTSPIPSPSSLTATIFDNQEPLTPKVSATMPPVQSSTYSPPTETLSVTTGTSPIPSPSSPTATIFDNQESLTPKVSATMPPVQSSTFSPPTETLLVTTGTSPIPSPSSLTATIFDNQESLTPKVSTTPPPVQSSTFILPTETLVVTTGTSPKPSPSSHTTTIFNRQTSSPKVFTESVVTTASTTLLSVCIPKCHWTPWYDENHPSLANEGDRESYEICKAKKGGVCKSKSHIQDIQCRANNFPNTLIAELGQKVQCDVSTGLTCHNEDNKGRFKMCFNFEISFFCCDDESHCTTMPPVQSSTFSPPTETLIVTTGTSPKPSPSSHTTTIFDNRGSLTPKVSATMPPVHSSTFRPPTETLVVITGTSPKPSPSSHTTTIFNRQTSSPKVFTESVVSTASTTLLSVCIPKCHWTPWYDENHPSLTNEGDRESYEICKAKKGGVCKSKSHIQDIQCRANNFPNTLIAELGQKVQCDVSTGLTCHNEDNKGRFKMCFNFEISFFCCDDESHCTTMPPVQSSTFSPPTETLIVTTGTSPKPSPSSHTTTIFDNRGSLTPKVSATMPPVHSSTFRPPTETLVVITGTSPKPSPSSHTTTIFNRQTSSPKVFTESVVSTASTTLLSVCIPKCHWTPWYDENHPSLTNEGDRESYEICKAKKGGVCKSKSHIQDIQCRAKNFPNTLIAELGQKVQCDVSTGLTCHNEDNKGRSKMCLNFEISFFCCDDESHCTTMPPVQSSTFSPPRETLIVTTGTSPKPSPSSHTTTIFDNRGSLTLKVSATMPPVQSSTFRPPTGTLLVTTGTSPKSSPSSHTTRIFDNRGSLTPKVSSTMPPVQSSTFSPPTDTLVSTGTSPIPSPSSLTTTIFDNQESLTPKVSATMPPVQSSTFSPPTDTLVSTGTSPIPSPSSLTTTIFDNQESLTPKVSATVPPVQSSTFSPTTETLVVTMGTSPIPSPSSLTKTIFDDQESLTPNVSTTMPPVQSSTFSPPTETLLITTGTSPIPSPSSLTTTIFDDQESLTPNVSTTMPPVQSSTFSPPTETLLITTGTSPIPSPSSLTTTIFDDQESLTPEVSTTLPPVQSSTFSPPTETLLVQTLKTSNLPSYVSTPEGYSPSISSIAMLTTSTGTVPYLPWSTLSPLYSTNSPATNQQRESIPKDVCEFNGSTFKVGDIITSQTENCEFCECSSTINGPAVKCMPVVCMENCKPAFAYIKKEGQCCGECIKTSCLLNDTVVIEPGKVWSPPGDKCTSYDCEPKTLIIIRQVVTCPVQSSLNCDQGTIVEYTSSDGCCNTPVCVRDTCSLKTTWKIVEEQGCSGNRSLSHCEGLCGSTSRYSSFSKNMEHKCSCCQGESTSAKEIFLNCKDGTRIIHYYTDVAECRCRETNCVALE